MQYYWLTANRKMWLMDYERRWSLEDMPVGERDYYFVKAQSGAKRRMASAFESILPGDVMFGYESSPVCRIVAILECTQASDGEKIWFRKIANVRMKCGMDSLRSDPILRFALPIRSPQGRLFALKREEAARLRELVG